jgi:hypothetical protein
VGRAGEDDRAGEKGLAAAEELDESGNVEDHVVGVPVLHRFAIENRADAERVGIRDFVPCHQHGAERAERVEALGLAPLAAAEIALPVAGGDIVGAGVAEDVVEGVGARDVLAALADDDGELALVVDLRAGELARELDGVAGVLNRGGVLDEEDGALGRRQVALGGVAFVIEPDAGEVRRDDGGEELAGLDGAVGG